MLQNKCLIIIEGWQIKQKLEPLFITFEIFNIDQLLNFEIAKFMFLYQRKKLGKKTRYRNYLTILSIILKLSVLLAKPGKQTRMIYTYPSTKQNVLKNQSNI